MRIGATRLAGMTLAMTVAFCAWLASCPAGEPGSTPVPAWSAQLHLHGSFSEGFGSMDSHAYQADELGVDVLWWSDHDFRLACYRLVSAFGFEGASEPIDRGEEWIRRLKREDRSSKTLLDCDLSSAPGSFEFSPDRPAEGDACLRVSSSAPSQRFRPYYRELMVKRGLHRRSLATGVTLELAVRPEQAGADARPVVLIGLSEHAPREDRPFATYALKYYLSNDESEPSQQGTTLRIPLAYEQGAWNRYRLSLTGDAVRGFPFLRGDDNVLGRICVGVETRGGAVCTACFDDLRVTSARTGDAALEEQRRLLDQLGPEHPRVRQLQGIEVSYETSHLNEFSVDTRLLDYDRIVADSGLADESGRIADVRAFKRLASDSAVEAAHARGGLISYNHMFGASEEDSEARSTRDEVLADLLENRCLGVDLLEVGYRDRGGHDLGDHLWVWDRLAEAGLPLVGTGVSDYHGGLGADGWRTTANNFVSWIYAPTREKPDLIEGLRTGRVFFGDITRFDGTLDVHTERGFRMGQVVFTDRRAARLRGSIAGLDPGDRITVVTSRGAALELAARGDTDAWQLDLELPGAGLELVRVEARDASGAPLVFSNPICFVAGPLLEGVAGERVGIDLAGLRCAGARRVFVSSVRAGGDRASLELRAEDGELRLAAEGREPAEVAMDGLSGEWSSEDGVLVLTGLDGEGSIDVRWGR